VTDDEAKALGLRAVAVAEWWRWMPGCRARRWGELVTVEWVSDEHGWTEIGINGSAINLDECKGMWPDFREPASWGCLLDLVCTAWGDVEAYVVKASNVGPPGRPWVVVLPRLWPVAHASDFAATRIEAAVMALETAAAARGTA
jgi:hypothetical protein